MLNNNDVCLQLLLQNTGILLSKIQTYTEKIICNPVPSKNYGFQQS